MSKSRDAFRTISEVSEALDTPAHVLRFWESKFSQIKPVKRAGGRRYYRPSDLNLLAGIKKLLHEDGMTIKGAQKLLREQGVRKIAQLGLENLEARHATGDAIEGTSTPVAAPQEKQSKDAVPEQADAGTVEDAVTVDDPSEDETVEASIATEDPAAAPVDTPADKTPANAPDDAHPVEGAIDITNVVTLPQSAPAQEPAPSGPFLSLDLATPAEEAAPNNSKTVEPDAPATVDVPDDPSDNDSKATARIFHLLRNAPPEALARHAAEIAPLLDRMQSLRDRIPSR